MKITFFLAGLFALGFSSCNDAPTPPTAADVADVDPEAAAKLVAEKSGLVILDVRTPEEFAEGHLPGAINIDFKGTDFAEKVGALDPDAAYLMHCRSGSRSKASLPVFKDLNFSELYHLNTGYLGWTEAGHPVEK